MKLGPQLHVLQQFEGGMGVAYLAEDLSRPGETFILKTYKDGHPDAASVKVAFTKEAQS